ncbi:AEC family transporter [Jannaschia sp. 2305UL9-9]|uniref:AEC family transporter n=1 Tax=Jannaschia sp. 2305UL9-9 TaxID=3121638 RepID=UPI0035289C42
MSPFAALADPILPIFAILAFGFGLGRARLMSRDDARVINRFAMTVLVPIAVFGLLANAPVDSFAALPILLYSLTQAVIFGGGYLLARRLFAASPAEAVILAYAGIFANTLFYTLPISTLLFGADDILPVTMVVVLDSVVSFGGVMIILQIISDGRASPLSVVRIFARTPALLAIAAGTFAALLHLSLPDAVQTFVTFNGVAAAPVALFALGVILSGTRFRADGAVAVFSAIKLVALPVAVFAAMIAAGIAQDTARLFTFTAAGPAGAMALSLALLHGVPTDRVAQVLVWTCGLSLITMAVLA